MRSALKRLFPAIHLFAETDELDGFASDRRMEQGPHRAGRPPSMRVSTTPEMPMRSLKFSAVCDGVLTVQAVDNQQGFTAGWRHRVPLDLLHQLFVDSTSGPPVSRQYRRHSRHGLACVSRFRDLDVGFTPLTIGSGDLTPMAHRRGIASCSIAAGAVDVKRGHQARACRSRFFQGWQAWPLVGGFTGALQADHQDRRRRHCRSSARPVFAFAFQRVDQRVVDNLDDLLAGGDRFGDRLTLWPCLARL